MINQNLPVLVVDDFKTTIRIVHSLLRQLGYENLDEAANGEEALRKLETKDYGLVLSDWNMEPMTGLELLKRLRATAKGKRTPFVMITAETTTDNVTAARQAGADGYIIKPFTAAVLKEKLSSIAAA